MEPEWIQAMQEELQQFELNNVWELICLRRIYNFLLFRANIIQLSHTFGNILHDLLD